MCKLGDTRRLVRDKWKGLEVEGIGDIFPLEKNTGKESKRFFHQQKIMLLADTPLELSGLAFIEC